MNKAIKCGKLFNSKDGTVAENQIILTDGEYIKCVVNAWELPEGFLSGYELIDLGDKFVMPGLVECHVHISEFGAPETFKTNATFLPGDPALMGLKNAGAQLMAGFTTLRNCGSPGFIDVSLKNAINSGMFAGPRIVASGSCIGSTGGHADSHYGLHIKTQNEYIDGQIADGPDGARRAARFVIKYGADLVKFMSTGGVTTARTTLGAQQFTYDEMRAMIEVAEMYGVTTATHAHGTSGIKTAVKAGVTSIEHGTIMDDECVELMVKKGTYLTPTIIAFKQIFKHGAAAGMPPFALEKTRQAGEYHEVSFRKCRDAGVKIVFGTDAGSPCNPHGNQYDEFKYMCEFGMTPRETLIAATKTGSELLRMQNSIGSIDAGKYADVIAVSGNPIENIEDMAKNCFVMKSGEIYKNIYDYKFDLGNHPVTLVVATVPGRPQF
jgi:imidazolonepropionase-like amidohydrolase